MVTEADLERGLALVRAAAGDNQRGVFGPGSLLWRIDREAAIFFAAGRALLLQLAHPWVAAAITQHSGTLSDPIGRFHRTFGVVFAMVFGTTDEAIVAARRLYRRHAAISGILNEDVGAFSAGSPYHANDIAALRWVFATLVDSAIVAFELVNPPLSAEERERYYAQSYLFAALFGIPQRALPQGWAEFEGYVDQMIGSDDRGRRRSPRDRDRALGRGRKRVGCAILVSRTDCEPDAGNLTGGFWPDIRQG